MEREDIFTGLMAEMVEEHRIAREHFAHWERAVTESAGVMRALQVTGDDLPREVARTHRRLVALYGEAFAEVNRTLREIVRAHEKEHPDCPHTHWEWAWLWDGETHH